MPCGGEHQLVPVSVESIRPSWFVSVRDRYSPVLGSWARSRTGRRRVALVTHHQERPVLLVNRGDDKDAEGLAAVGERAEESPRGTSQ